MKKTLSVIFGLALIFIWGCKTAEPVNVKDFGNSTKIYDFDVGMPKGVESSGTELKLVDSEYGKALEVVFIASEENPYPGATFTLPNLMDWTDKTLDFDLYNKSDDAVSYYMRVDGESVDGANGLDGCYTYNVTVQPHTSVPVTLVFKDDGRNYGMKALPGSVNKKVWGKDLEINKITKFLIYQMSPTENSTIIVDNFALTPAIGGGIDIANIVDKYGQYARNEYTNKIYSDEQLVAAKESEEVSLADVVPGKMDGRSRFGGWLNEEKRQEPGDFFRAQKVGDKWWLVDPDGYLFFSVGMDIIRNGDSYTLITSREDMFQELPAKDGDFSDHWDYATSMFDSPVPEGDIYSFYTANLERKYGEKWEEEWKETALKRTAAWGFTSFGNWSDPALFGGKGDENKISYFEHGWITGNHDTLPSGSNYWGELPDPFDPVFRENAKLTAEKIYSEVGDDPWCVGVFVDNEMSWGNNQSNKMYYGLIYSVFAETMDNNAKNNLLPMLKNNYNGDISALNAKWGTNIASWNVLEASYDVDANFTEGMKDDLSFLLGQYAEKYYSVVREELRAAGVKQMYLGSRNADWGRPDEVVRAAAKNCDVVSYNWYKKNADKKEFTLLEELDVPAIIGEFNFVSCDRDNFRPGTVSCSSQAQRGKMYQDYIQSVLDEPFFVGAHWFQYYDQPITGRAWDGENANTGFVSVTDQPHEELVKAATSINNKLYTIRDESTIYYNAALVISNLKELSFEGSDTTAEVSKFKRAKFESVTDNVTDGSTGILVNVGVLDSDYSGINIDPTSEIGKYWNWGSNCTLKADFVNPNKAKIQIRINLIDYKGTTRTYYFNMEGSEARTLEIPYTSMLKASDDWSLPDGFFGGNAGLDTEKMKEISIYIWEDNDFGSTAKTFILDNLRVENK